MPLLSVINLGISFGGLKAVDDFNFEIEEKELVGLIGPNGAGKTTVFNLLTGVYQPTHGAILLNDKSILGKKPYQIVKSGIARTFQNIRLFKSMTVLENVMVTLNQHMRYSMGEAFFRLPRFWKEEKWAYNKAMELLEVFNLQDYAFHVADNLPYGQQRKLEIARALAADPKVLLLDEPAAGMNPTETASLMETIKFIRDKFEISILLIEHDMSLVMGICERIVVLDYGSVIATGTPREIAHDAKVITAYLGE